MGIFSPCFLWRKRLKNNDFSMDCFLSETNQGPFEFKTQSHRRQSQQYRQNQRRGKNNPRAKESRNELKYDG